MSSSITNPSSNDSPHLLDNILSSLHAKGIIDSHDTLFLVLHSFMLSSGFRLVGLGDNGNIIGEERTLPTIWKEGMQIVQPSQQQPSMEPSSSGSSSMTSQQTSSSQLQVQPCSLWSFRYRHSKSSMTFVLKALRLGSRLSIHAYIVEQDDIVVNMEVVVADYVDNRSDEFSAFLSSFQSSSSSTHPSQPISNTSPSSSTEWNRPWTNFLKNIERLHELFKNEVMVKLMPTVEDLANQLRIRNVQSSSGVGVGAGSGHGGAPQIPPASQGPRRDPLRVYPEDRQPRYPVVPRYPPGYGPGFVGHVEDDDDGFGVPGGFGGGPMGHYGDGDLFGSFGRYGEQVPGGYRGGFGGGSGGSEIGPHHPGFGPGVNDPYAMPRGGRGGGAYGTGGFGSGGVGAPPDFHAPPPGARFDPFGPPPNPSSAPRPNPHPPDAPPGFDSMFS